MKKISVSLLLLYVIFGGAVLRAQSNLSTNVAGTNLTSVSSNTNGFLYQYYRHGKQSKDVKEVTAVSPFWSIVKILFFTALLAFGGYALIRYLVKKSGLPSTEDEKLIEIVLSKPAGLGNYLEIIKMGPSYYLLSVSGEGIRLIDKIEDKETIDYIELHKDELKPKETKFFDLMSMFPQIKKSDKLGFLKKQKDKLRKM